MQFWEQHPDSKRQLESWYSEAKMANWQDPAQLKAQYRSASVLKGGKVVFNICGNKYRLGCVVLYEQGIVFTKFLGTHKEYDATDPEAWR